MTHPLTKFQQNSTIRGRVILRDPQSNSASQRWVNRTTQIWPGYFNSVDQSAAELLMIRSIFTARFSVREFWTACFSKLGKRPNLVRRLVQSRRFECTFWISDVLLHFEIRTPSTGLAANRDPIFVLFTPPLAKISEGADEMSVSWFQAHSRILSTFRAGPCTSWEIQHIILTQICRAGFSDRELTYVCLSVCLSSVTFVYTLPWWTLTR